MRWKQRIIIILINWCGLRRNVLRSQLASSEANSKKCNYGLDGRVYASFTPSVICLRQWLDDNTWHFFPVCDIVLKQNIDNSYSQAFLKASVPRFKSFWVEPGSRNEVICLSNRSMTCRPLHRRNPSLRAEKWDRKLGWNSSDDSHIYFRFCAVS